MFCRLLLYFSVHFIDTGIRKSLTQILHSGFGIIDHPGRYRKVILTAYFLNRPLNILHRGGVERKRSIRMNLVLLTVPIGQSFLQFLLDRVRFINIFFSFNFLISPTPAACTEGRKFRVIFQGTVVVFIYCLPVNALDAERCQIVEFRVCH